MHARSAVTEFVEPFANEDEERHPHSLVILCVGRCLDVCLL